MTQKRLAYIFVIPASIFLLLFLVLPILANFAISLFDISINPKNWLHSSVSFDNYLSAVRQDGFINAVKNSIVYTIVTSFCTAAIGLLVALCCRRPFKGRGIALTLIMLSWVLPSYVAGIFFGVLFQQDNSIFNYMLFDILHFDVFLGWFGFNFDYNDMGQLITPRWLGGDNAVFAVAIPAIWHYFPYSMLLFLMGLNSVKKDVNDAAIMDGAKNLEKFFYITLPMLKPVFIAVLVQNCIINIYSFNIIIMMFGNGTIIPSKGADMLMTYIFRTAFQSWHLGVGAALSTMLMAVVGFAVLVYYRGFREDDYADT